MYSLAVGAACAAPWPAAFAVDDTASDIFSSYKTVL